MDLGPGLDLRLPEYRVEVFQRFYQFHLRHGSHPGGVYFLMPYLAEALGWGEEELLWFALLNGHTQHPMTSLALHRQGPTPDHADAVVDWWRANIDRLPVDTDRRHHARKLDQVIGGYVAMLGGRRQGRFWRDRAHAGFGAVWDAARAIPTFGRLSAFSYAEYLTIAGMPFECETLFLDDRSGSRSHRNGLAIVCGLDQYDWHSSNPNFDGRYSQMLIEHLDGEAAALLAEARRRSEGQTWARWTGLFTLESALCTYKSWHRPRRRYPNVYMDMMYDRLQTAALRMPEQDLDVFWQARRDCLPEYLRLEDVPSDPGCVPVKQDHYRLTGEVVMMGREDGQLWGSFEEAVDAGEYGQR